MFFADFGESKMCCFKEFVFDWQMCFHPGEVYCVQNLVGLELQVKYILIVVIFSKNRRIAKEYEGPEVARDDDDKVPNQCS